MRKMAQTADSPCTSNIAAPEVSAGANSENSSFEDTCFYYDKYSENYIWNKKIYIVTLLTKA